MTSRISEANNPSTRAASAENSVRRSMDGQEGITRLWDQASSDPPAGSQFSRIREFLKKENKLERI